MDNRISIGDKIDLEKIETRLMVDPNEKKMIYVSQVLDEAKEDRMLVAMPIHEGRIIPMSVGQKFKATFYTKNGLQCCEMEVTARYKKGSLFLMELEQLTLLNKIQRREYFRFECRLPISYRVVEGEERQILESGQEYNMDDWDMEWKDAIMLDLSGGGIRFISKFFEGKDIFVQVKFDILCDDIAESVYAFAKLLRIEKNPNNDSLYDHRVKFWRMDNSMREKIIRYIFEEQCKKRSKQLG